MRFLEHHEILLFLLFTCMAKQNPCTRLRGFYISGSQAGLYFQNCVSDKVGLTSSDHTNLNKAAFYIQMRYYKC